MADKIIPQTFLYARASTQRQELSGDAQLGIMQGYLTRHPEIPAPKPQNIITHTYDEATSGRVGFFSRPEILPVMERIRPGDNFLCADVDRLGRDTIDILSTVRTLRTTMKINLHVVLWFGCFVGDDPDAELMLTIRAGMAQWERRQTGRRTSAAKIAMMRAGLCPGFHSPLPWRRVRTKRDLATRRVVRHGYFVVDEEKLAMARRIAAMHEIMPVWQIQKILEHEARKGSRKWEFYSKTYWSQGRINRYRHALKRYESGFDPNDPEIYKARAEELAAR